LNRISPSVSFVLSFATFALSKVGTENPR
jgi:hypothetical protein